MKKYFKYSIEMFKNGVWVTELRFYEVEKNLNDFDLKDILGVRRNAQLIEADTDLG